MATTTTKRGREASRLTIVNPCPFCGAKAETAKEIIVEKEHISRIRCVKCGATGPTTAYFTATIRRWNERAIA